jgi:sulfite reductase alpha subunit-like flavoprotein
VFGCRSESKDFYYNKEWVETPNLKLITAFSRDQIDGSKQYVQHAIRREGYMLSKMIVSQGAYVFVSGRAKNMPKSVEKAIVEIIF